MTILDIIMSIPLVWAGLVFLYGATWVAGGALIEIVQQGNWKDLIFLGFMIWLVFSLTYFL